MAYHPAAQLRNMLPDRIKSYQALPSEKGNDGTSPGVVFWGGLTFLIETQGHRTVRTLEAPFV